MRAPAAASGGFRADRLATSPSWRSPPRSPQSAAARSSPALTFRVPMAARRRFGSPPGSAKTRTSAHYANCCRCGWNAAVAVPPSHGTAQRSLHHDSDASVLAMENPKNCRREPGTAARARDHGAVPSCGSDRAANCGRILDGRTLKMDSGHPRIPCNSCQACRNTTLKNIRSTPL